MLRTTILLLIILVFPACTTSVVVEGSVPTPLVPKMPVRMGVHFSEEFRNFRHQEQLPDGSTWDINMGSQNLRFFRKLVDALFTSAREVGKPPLAPTEMQGLDGIFVPRVEEYGFLAPAVSGMNFYAASIEYRILMYNGAGKRVGEWQVIGYGRSAGGAVTGDGRAINEATVQAIRDGSARIALELASRPGVRGWLLEIQGPPDEPAGGQK